MRTCDDATWTCCGEAIKRRSELGAPLFWHLWPSGWRKGTRGGRMAEVLAGHGNG